MIFEVKGGFCRKRDNYKIREMKTWKDIVRWALAACLLWATGCGRLIYDEYPDEADPSSRAYLVLNIASAAPTRAADDKELMHSLRVVLLDEDGKVEYNDYITSLGRPDLFGAAGIDPLDYAEKYRLIPTTPGEKKIFLIANEEGVENAKGVSGTISNLTSYLGGFSKGDGGFEAAVNNLYFTPTYAGNIPLSSCYEFTVDASAVGTRVPKTFYLVHAATKFQFEFINKRLSPVRIDALSVSSIAEDMYLMGHVNGSDYKKTPPGESEPIYWVDWLAKVSEETTQSPNDKDLDNADTNRKWGWITDYTIPEATTHGKADIITAGGWTESNKNNWITIPQGGGTYTHPTIYYPESKYIPSGRTDQVYSFSVTLTDTDAKMTGTFEPKLTFPSSEDQNLVALFRNTFVKVTCTVGYDDMKDVTLTLRIGICPWNEETIDIPAFD